MKLEGFINKINEGIESKIASVYAMDSNCEYMYFEILFDTFNVIIEYSCRNGETDITLFPYRGLTDEHPNVEKFIRDRLIDMDDILYTCQMAYKDYWDGVDDGCDPAFPHYGDFERWAYGR